MPVQSGKSKADRGALLDRAAVIRHSPLVSDGHDKFARYLTVLENTADYLAINKQPGVPFQAAGKDPGVLPIIREMEELGLIEAGPRLFPVHRLDKVTSGILLFARGRKNANLIGNEFRHNRVEKYYAAISDRAPHKKQGLVRGDMIKGRGGAWILTRENKNPAVTRFISRSIPGRRPGLRLFLVRPRTGRTHQIRVALKSLGAPILGDSLYGRYDLAREEDRAYLHACALRFRLGEQTITLRCNPGPGFEFENPAFEKVWTEFADPFALEWPGDKKQEKRKPPVEGPTEKKTGKQSPTGKPAVRKKRTGAKKRTRA